MLQKKTFLFLTSICILLVVWLISMIHCRMPDQEGMTTDTDTNKILYACFDDRTGNMLQSCKNNINDFATNLSQINKKDLDTAYNSIINEGGCFDNNSGQMLQQCKDVIYQVASNFTQITKTDVDNGVSTVSNYVNA